MKYVVCMSLWPHTTNILISNWSSMRKFSQLSKNASREDRCFSLFSPLHVSHISHPLHSIFMLWLVKFDMWVHAENLYMLKLLNFDSWSWQGFVSTCDVLNCLFPLAVQNEILLQGCALKKIEGSPGPVWNEQRCCSAAEWLQEALQKSCKRAGCSSSKFWLFHAAENSRITNCAAKGLRSGFKKTKNVVTGGGLPLISTKNKKSRLQQYNNHEIW